LYTLENCREQIHVYLELYNNANDDNELQDFAKTFLSPIIHSNARQLVDFLKLLDGFEQRILSQFEQKKIMKNIVLKEFNQEFENVLVKIELSISI